MGDAAGEDDAVDFASGRDAHHAYVLGNVVRKGFVDKLRFAVTARDHGFALAAVIGAKVCNKTASTLEHLAQAFFCVLSREAHFYERAVGEAPGSEGGEGALAAGDHIRDAAAFMHTDTASAAQMAHDQIDVFIGQPQLR